MMDLLMEAQEQQKWNECPKGESQRCREVGNHGKNKTSLMANGGLFVRCLRGTSSGDGIFPGIKTTTVSSSLFETNSR
jgi:hypothetical protein